MGFFNTLKEVITNKPSNLTEPHFIKEFNEDNKQLKELTELLNVASSDAAKAIEQDIKLLTYGLIGEKNVAYELKNSHMPILILHDLYLQYKGLSAQIDFVVIDQKFILAIECKNMVGDIEITNNGDFIRYFKSSSGKVYKKEGMYSPIVQNERHVELLRDILMAGKYISKNSSDMVKHIVTVANPKAVINSKYAKKEIKEHIIKHDQLINKMKQLHEANKNGYWFTEESMYNIADCLLKYSSEYNVNYEQKYGISLYSECENMKNETVSVEVNRLKSEEVYKTALPMEENTMYKALKEYRLNKSREENIKPYFLYNNSQLEAIVEAKPKNIEELKSIKGFGEVKCDKYGNDIVEIIRSNL